MKRATSFFFYKMLSFPEKFWPELSQIFFFFFWNNNSQNNKTSKDWFKILFGSFPFWEIYGNFLLKYFCGIVSPKIFFMSHGKGTAISPI